MTPFPNPEYLIYREHKFYILGMSNGTLLSPHSFDIQPNLPFPPVGRNYIGTHKIIDNQLVLDRFAIADKNDKTVFSAINGIFPTIRKEKGIIYRHSEKKWFSLREEETSLTYFDLNIEEYYTGGMIIGIYSTVPAGIWWSLFSAYFYVGIVEILFENGIVMKIIDHSKLAEEARKRYEGYTQSDKHVGHEVCNQILKKAYAHEYYDFSTVGWERPKDDEK